MIKLVSALVTSVCLAASMAPANAGEFPEKSFTYVIPFGPGGESDLTARFQQKVYKEKYGQGMVVSNKPGGGGAVAWAQLNNMKKDGYTIMGVNLPHIIIKPQQKNVGFKTDDIDSVYIFQHTPDALAVHKDSPFKTLKDLVDYAKKNPKKVTLAGSGKGSANHLLQVAFSKEAGIETTYVAMKGTGATINAVAGKQVSGAATYTPAGAKYEETVRLLAVGTEERHPRFPDTPTFKELGYNIVGGGAYRGVAVPKGTPEELRQEVSSIIHELNTDPEFVKNMEDLGFSLLNIPASETKAFIKEKTGYFIAKARAAGVIK